MLLQMQWFRHSSVYKEKGIDWFLLYGIGSLQRYVRQRVSSVAYREALISCTFRREWSRKKSSTVNVVIKLLLAPHLLLPHWTNKSRALAQGSPTPGPQTATGLQPVRNRAAWQVVSGRRASEASSAAPHRSHHHLNHSPHTLPPSPWKNCLPQSWSPVPKRLGNAVLAHSLCGRQVHRSWILRSTVQWGPQA